MRSFGIILCFMVLFVAVFGQTMSAIKSEERTTNENAEITASGQKESKVEKYSNRVRLCSWLLNMWFSYHFKYNVIDVPVQCPEGWEPGL